jgi:lysophospholipase L1-like esterase
VAPPQPVTLGANPPQLNALSASTTLVTLDIGGNDLGFASIVIACSGLSLTSPLGSPCKNRYTAGGTDQLAQLIARTGPKVAAVLAGIHQRAPQARVLLVGYPDVLPSTGHGCWPAVPIAHGDVPYLRGVETGLNAMLASEAAAGDATFVDTYSDSIGHDFCQPKGVKWVEGLVPTSPAAPVHPNALGEKAMAQQVLAAAG